MTEDAARFVEKGNTIVMKQRAPEDYVMDSRELLIQVKTIEDTIEKTKEQLKQIEANRIHGEANIQGNKGRLKELKKFEAKMMAIQESKAKAIFNDIKKECEEKVRKEYKYDEALIEADNKVQMFAIYQRTIATHEKTAKELAPQIITKLYYKESILNNPFK